MITLQAKCIQSNCRQTLNGTNVDTTEEIILSVAPDPAKPGFSGTINLTNKDASQVGQFKPGQSYPVQIG